MGHGSERKCPLLLTRYNSVPSSSRKAGPAESRHCSSPDFTAAEAEFRKILAIDPYRVDDIDILSNILYVTENNTALSKLAHDYLAIEKDRPEICCIIGESLSGLLVSVANSSIGNYYSLRAEHEKAVKYFRRATQLDRTYLSAWTLMGHEYVEMKNSHAAIEAYRKAVGTYGLIDSQTLLPDSY